MFQVDQYLLLASPDAPMVPVECFRLPMESGAIRNALAASLAAAAAEAAKPDVRVYGAVVPVVSEGPPDPKLVGAVAWLAAQGRYRPLEMFEVTPGEDVEPVIRLIAAIQAANADPGEPDPELMAGGMNIQM